MKQVFIIPMAGESRRFTEAGYDRPKFQLELHGQSVFAWSISSFRHYFGRDDIHFRIIFQDKPGIEDFIRAECTRLGLSNVSLVGLGQATSGQAETVFLGLEGAPWPQEAGLTIFNIDTFCPGFRLPSFAETPASDFGGYLDVFEGEGANWSYVKPVGDGNDLVAETAEKLPISNLCCTGLYGFASLAAFRFAYTQKMSPRNEAERRERYVAPLYNALIGKGLSVHYRLVPRRSVIFCGVPAEYDALRAGDRGKGDEIAPSWASSAKCWSAIRR